MKWNELTDTEQVYLYWEFVAMLDDDQTMEFTEFDALARAVDNDCITEHTTNDYVWITYTTLQFFNEILTRMQD